jgi:ATP-binding cassette subfamily F protein 3
VGKNGEGKSTLARILLGDEEFQSGIRKPGFKSGIQYYAQHQADSLNPVKTVLETLDEVATGEIRKKLRTLLGCFLFKGDDVFKHVSVLSGGEKSRLALAVMLLKPSNFLILDEPTNHLDMNSKHILMNALKKYGGTVMVISHDREFLDGIVSKIIEVKDRNIKSYQGNCTEFLRKKAEVMTRAVPDSVNGQKKPAKKTKEVKKLEAESRNNYYRRMKPVADRLKEVEEKIAKKEERRKELENEMAAELFYKDSTNVIKVNKEMKILKEELEGLYEEWIVNDNKIKSLAEAQRPQRI